MILARMISEGNKCGAIFLTKEKELLFSTNSQRIEEEKAQVILEEIKDLLNSTDKNREEKIKELSEQKEHLGRVVLLIEFWLNFKITREGEKDGIIGIIKTKEGLCKGIKIFMRNLAEDLTSCNNVQEIITNSGMLNGNLFFKFFNGGF